MKTNFTRFLLVAFLFLCVANTNAQTITTTESRCVNSGEVIFSGTVGAGGPYQISVITHPATYTPEGSHIVQTLPDTFSALFPGTYSFKIIDQLGAVFNYTGVVVTGNYILPGNNDYTPVATNVTNCNPLNGTIQGTMTNGRPPYTYKIIAGPSQVGTINTTGNFSGLVAGNYKVQAADSCQNIQTRDAIINDYTLSIAYAAIKIANCNSYSLDSLRMMPAISGALHYSIINYNTNGDSIVRATSDIIPFSFTLFSKADVAGGRVKIKVSDDCGNNAFFSPLQYTNLIRDTLMRGVINKISCDSFSLESMISQLQFPEGAMVTLQNLTSGVIYNSILPVHFKATRNDISSGNILITVTDSCGNLISTNKFRTTDWSFSQDLKIKCDGTVELNSLDINGFAIQPYTIRIKAFFRNSLGRSDSTSSQVVNSFPYTVTGITGTPNPLSVRIEVTDSCGEMRSRILSRSFNVSANADFLDCNLSAVNASAIGLYEPPVTYSVSPAAGTSANTTGYFELPHGSYTITATDSCGFVSTTNLNLNPLWELLPARQGKSCITGFAIDSIWVPRKSAGRTLTIRQYDGSMPVTASSPLLRTQLFTSGSNGCISCPIDDTTGEKIIFDSTLAYHTYSYVVIDSCGNSDTISVTNGSGLQPFYHNIFSKNKCAGGSDIYANWRNDGDIVIISLFDSAHHQVLRFNSGSNTNLNTYPNGQVLLQNAITGMYTLEYSFAKCPQLFIDTVFSREYVQPTITAVQSFTPCNSSGQPVIVTAADGVAPYSYEIVDTYPNHYTAAPQTSAVFNLPNSQSTATVRVLDACLNSAIITLPVTGATLPVIHSNPLVLPTCAVPFAITLFTDSVYEASVFEWIKLTGTNAGTAVISTRPSLSLLYYSIADTGTYKVTVKIPGTCFDTSATFALKDLIVSCTGLPVIITNFTGVANGNSVKLNWLVAEQINILHYTIEWSNDGEHFQTIGVLNATNTSSYNMLHTTAASGLNYYRLKITENDGRIVYSKIVTVQINTAPVITVKPNPFKGSVDIVMELQKNSAVKIIMYDAAGRQVYQNTFTGSRGRNDFIINYLDKLSKGIYLINVLSDDFIFQKKVLKQ